MSIGKVSQLAAASLAAILAASVTGCSAGQPASGPNAATASAGPTTGVTINVTLPGSAPAKASLDQFTKDTGITVNWTTLDWDSLQTKISTSATSKTYFADVTDVDWSRAGQLAKLQWFHPLDQFLDTKAIAADMPQLSSFTVDGKVIGIPNDASFMVTTVNSAMFKKAGADPAPKTISDYTAALKKIQTAGVSEHPLNIPFAAAEGLSTYWYQTTAAFGGDVLDKNGAPQFTDPQSAGYKAANWMVDALKSGLVPAGSINANDGQGQQDLMAKGQVASTFSDYAGNVGSLYNVAASSSVTGDGVKYLPTPGESGPGANLSNPDGVGIPSTAKYPAAAAKFIQWLTSAQTEADFAGLNGDAKALSGYSIPSSLAAVQQLADKGALADGKQLADLLKSSRPVFPGGAPTWYTAFSNAVYTHLHNAATGDETVDSAMKAIAAVADQHKNGS
ncbi:ABC transporter substrate-binding protein [Arthrobacter sp. KNU-44]|uniref:ABC transporter substrate-binding protein n=1 Tax=Arthrobacter sp. KNU-44 TaxID=3450744 RepID=UPI003F42C8C8